MKKVLFFFICILSISANAQTFVLDETFNQGGTGFTGFGKVVNESLIQPDGKIIIVGNGLNDYNGTPCSNVLRLNEDGTIDTTFILPTDVNGSVLSVALDLQGNIYVGGSFTSFNGALKSGIVRLFPNGTLDNSFSVNFPNNGTYHIVYDIDVENSGAIYIGGSFYAGSGNNGRYAFAKLTNTGEINMPPSAVGFGPNDRVSTIERQSDGKIYLSGFWSISSLSNYGFMRLNADCTLDTAFDSLCTIGGTAYSIYIQPDNKILLGGLISLEFGGDNYTLVRINPDGTLDESFQSHPAPYNSTTNNVVACIIPYQDGFMTSGKIPTDSFWYTPALLKVGQNGTIDSNLNVGQGFYGSSSPTITAIHLQGGGKILATGNFVGFNEISKVAIARLAPESLGVEDVLSKSGIYYNRGQSVIVSPKEQIRSIVIYDLSSREVFRKKGIDGYEYSLGNLLSGQMLIAVVATENGVSKLKILR